jgi:hypothetical protein
MKKIYPLILALALAVVAPAQNSTATVVGRVADSTDAAVPGVAVTLTGTETGLSLNTNSAEDGTYVFSLVRPGRYRLSLEKSGFQKFKSEDFDLEVDETQRFDVKLTVGQVSETITVSERPGMVEADTSSLGEVMTNREVEQLPVDGRNPFELAALVAGVQPGGSFGDGLTVNRMAAIMAGVNNFQTSGGVAGSNEILLDGAPITLCCQGQPALIPSMDVTSQMKVQTNTSSSEFGRSSGGVLNVITKSGTNEVHGSAYDFFKNDQLDAAGFNVNRSGKPPIPGRDDFRPPLRSNQFGFTLGAPVLIPRVYSGKNRTFFFVGFEGTETRNTTFNTIVVPPAEIRGGNFSSAPYPVYDVLSTAPNPASPGQSIRTIFPGNQIPASRISAIAMDYMKFYPEPTREGTVQNFDYIAKIKTSDQQTNARIDHNFDERNRFFGRFSILNDDYLSPDWLPNEGPNGGPTSQHQIVNAQTVVLDYTKVLTSSLVLDVRYSFAKQRNQNLGTAVDYKAADLGFPASFAALQAFQAAPEFSITGYAAIGNQTLRNWDRYTHALTATVSWVRGDHTVKAGWDGRLLLDNELTLDGGAGTFSFTGTWSNGPNPNGSIPLGQQPYDAFADFLLGNLYEASITYNDTTARIQHYNGFFVQDDWHASRRLTLNIGVRLDVEDGFHERYNRQSWFDPNAPTPMAAATGLPITGAVEFSGVNGQPTNLWGTTFNISPRFGLAYSITPKTVLRGAYGIMYLPTSQRGYGSSQPGYNVSTSAVTTINGVNFIGTLNNPFPNGVNPLTESSLGPLTNVGTSVGALLYDTPRSYTQQWNFGIQRELPSNILLSVAYAGGHSVHLPVSLTPNDLQPQYYSTPGNSAEVSALEKSVKNPFYGNKAFNITTGTLSTSTVEQYILYREYPQFTTVTEQYLGIGSSVYDSLQVSLQKTLRGGLSMRSSYTFSKNIGDVSNRTTGFLDTGNFSFQNSWFLKLERSVVPNDVPHRFVWSGTYDLPFGRGRAFLSGSNVLVNAILGGWQTNGTVQIQSGFPLQFTATGVPAFGGSRPNYTSLDPTVFTSGPIVDRLGGISGGPGFLNKSAFSLPLSLQLGNVPVTTPEFRAPLNSTISTSLNKYFPIREYLRLQFRAEIFNPFNNVVFAGPTTQLGSTSFGVSSGQSNRPRTLQLALKLLW